MFLYMAIQYSQKERTQNIQAQLCSVSPEMGLLLPDEGAQGRPGPGLWRLLLRQAQAAFESPGHLFACLEKEILRTISYYFYEME